MPYVRIHHIDFSRSSPWDMGRGYALCCADAHFVHYTDSQGLISIRTLCYASFRAPPTLSLGAVAHMEHLYSRLLLRQLSARRFACMALGMGGYHDMCRSVHRLLQWVTYVGIVETGTWMTLSVVGLFGTQFALSGRIAIWVHGGIVVLGLARVVIAEIMDLVEYIIGRVARVRTRWMRAHNPKAPSVRGNISAPAKSECGSTH